MQIAVAFHAADRDQCARWLSWVEELGGMGRHTLHIMPQKGQTVPDTRLPYTLVPDAYGLDSNWSSHEKVRDASGANSMVRQFAWYFADKGAWLFCEPDAIPLRPTWADELEDEYRASGKAFMGCRIPAKAGEYVEHSTGNMILPQNACDYDKLMLPTRAKIGQNWIEIAFDVAAADQVLANFHATRLIQQIFRGARFETQDDLARINPDACLFHNDKFGDIPRLLREKMNPIIETNRAMLNHIAENLLSPEPQPEPVWADKKVHTYCDWSDDPKYRAEQEKVLELWKQNWTEHGFETVVLNENDSRKHPLYERYRKVFDSFPTINPKRYEMSAWLRHVAMAAIGGGLLVDYDLLNNGVTGGVQHPERKFPTVLSDHNPVPFAISGTGVQFQNAIDAFLECQPITENGKPHLSDMHCVQMLAFPAVDNAREWNKEDRNLSGMLHFGHYSCAPRQRSEVMREWMEGRSQLKKAVAVLSALPEPNPEPLLEQLTESVRIVSSVKDAVKVLVDESRKPMGKARVVAELAKAGIIPKKKK